MKTMAQVEGNRVLNIIVASDDQPETESLVTYTDSNPAWIDGDYIDGYFYSPQPYPSWTRDKGKWIPPVPMPTDGKRYLWNEEQREWQRP